LLCREDLYVDSETAGHGDGAGLHLIGSITDKHGNDVAFTANVWRGLSPIHAAQCIGLRGGSHACHAGGENCSDEDFGDHLHRITPLQLVWQSGLLAVVYARLSTGSVDCSALRLTGAGP
ncbi:MAG: hypothetical protein RJB01_761, partial [Actinomycetota bacterium]